MPITAADVAKAREKRQNQLKQVTAGDVSKVREKMLTGQVMSPAAKTGGQAQSRTGDGLSTYQRALALDGNDSAGEKYVTYNDWLESGTETESDRRRGLISRISQAEKDVTREAYTGQRKLTGTVAEMADAVLEQEGYSPEEISEARKMAEYYDGMGLYDAGRRTAQTVKGTATTIASFVPQAIEYTKQRIENIISTEQARAEELETLGADAVTSRDPETGERKFLSPEQAMQATAAREQARLDAQEPVSQDSFGFKMYQSGQEALEDAMRGESEGQRFVHSALTSAGENLALAAINPVLVLPALTIQGAADSLAEATASGKTPGHAMVSAGLKAGIGWVIEEAGVAQMAQNMGKKFAASALSENILNFIRSAPGMEALQQGAPVLYGILASGADEAVEEFVESYADKLVDVALGDADASELASLEQLAEAGMGAAGGALGGAMIGGVSSGIGVLRGAYGGSQTDAAAPAELAAQQAQTQQEAQARQTQTPASADLSERLDAVQAAVTGTAQQAAQSAEQAAQPMEQAEGRPTAEPAAEPPAAQAQQSGLLDAFMESGRLEGPAWDALRDQQAQDRQEAARQQYEAQRHAERMTEREAWNETQQEQAWILENNTSMSEAAVNVAVEAMPEDVGGEVYSAAANTLYRLARSGIAEDMEDALRLASQNGARVGQVLAVPGGESALRQIYNQGKLEGLEADEYGHPGLAPENQAGTVTYEPGTQIPEEDRALLDLSAAASDTAVTVREKLENNAAGYIDTALGQIYFAAEEGQDTFGTILHEQTHLYNALDPEGGRALQTSVLRALAENRGFEQVDGLIESYIQRHQEAGQPISYAQACEEVAADAWRGVFGSVESLTRWARHQAAQAEQNAESRGTIRKMMDTVKGILDHIIQKAKQILAREPENTAARWAMELAESQKQALEQEYYRHQDAALEAQRAARQGGQTETRQTSGEAESGTEGRRAAQLREDGAARSAENPRRAEYPQAGWTGKGDAAYDTLAELPDMEITPIDTRAVEGKNYREIVADAFENMGAGREATRATVTNRYTGMEITVKRKSIEHSFNAGRQIKTRGPYVEQIGSILENAVKVNELEPRNNEIRSDIYLGAAENEKGELVGVRLIVNVFENGRAELDAANLETESGKLYAHLGTKIGDAEASPIGAPAFEAGGHAVSRSPLQGPRASTAEAEPSHTISIADLIRTVNETERVAGEKNIANWLEGVLSEDVRQRIGSDVAAPADMADSLRYQLPVDDTPTESGQKMAAWENVDRAEVEKRLEEAYREKDANRIPVENIRGMAQRLLRETQSRENQITLAKRLQALGEYLSSGKAEGRTALEMAEDIAEGLMRKSGKRDTGLWDQYPDLHYFTLYVKRGGTEYRELVYQYGDYKNAQKELARYGITLTTGEAHKDSAIDRVYQVLADDYGRFFPEEITGALEQVDRIAQVREMIRPTIQNAYGENWEEARADLGMQILGGMVREGVTDQTMAGMLTQRIDENLNRHRAGIQERVANSLGRIEREARAAARADAQRIVNQAAEGNRKRAEEWAKMDANQRTALARSRDALQRARDARSADATRRAIAANVTKLNRMLLHPSEKSHVPAELLQDALTIAQIGNAVTYNDETLLNLQALESRMKKYAKDGGDADGLAADFEASGILDMLESLSGSLSARRSRSTRAEAQADAAARNTERGLNQLYDLQGAQEEWHASAVLSENVSKNGAPRLNRLTAAEMNTIRDLTSAILTAAQNSNKLMAAKTNLAASEFANEARAEVETSREKLGDNPGLFKRLGLKYHENVLKAENFFAILGGYRHGGAMETLARTLAAGEARQTAIREEGIRRFSDVLDGKENREKLKRFAGPEAELVDVGLTGGAKVSHAQAVSLWLHLQNEQNAEHVLRGGVKIPDMKEYAKGKMEEAYRKSTVEHFALDNDLDYAIQVQGIRNRIESVLDEYDWAWIRDLQDFFDGYTKGKINETSQMLSGYDRAAVEKYFPLAVDPDTLQRQIEGVVYNGTIEGRGFLKERKQHAAQPVLLEECSQVMQRSLSDVAAYAGLAPAIRDFNKIWNANRGEGGSLKAAIRQNFGAGGVQYVEDYISDLQHQPRGRKSMLDALNGVRGRYAGAVLTLNLKVALGQVSGVLASGSELGAKHTAAALDYMVKRMTGRLGKGEDAAIRQEMMDWGYWGLEGTLSDGPTAELAELKSRKDAVSRITEKLPGANVLETMDKLTREGIWVGAKSYVADHLTDYGLTQADADNLSAGYRAAVVSLATDTINRTQPNYTVSQLAAIQRNPNQLAKILTMFKTQGFQNYGVLQYAIGDYRAQDQRLQEAQQAAQRENLSADQRQQAAQALETAKQQAAQAGQRLKMAVGSQAVQALVYAAIINAVSALAYHRLDDLRDEDGEITLASVMGKVLLEGAQSATTDNVFLLPEAMAVLGNLFGVRDDDPVSLTGIDAFGSFGSDLYKVYQLVTAGEMDFPTAADKLTDLAGSAFNLVGLPFSTVKRQVEGVLGWGQDIYKTISTEGVSLGDVINTPTSSSQYDELYAAAFETGNPEDAADALAALEKLDKLDPPKKPGDAKAGDTKILSELLKREKEFGSLIGEAAAARVSGDSAAQEKAMGQLVDTLAGALGIDKNTSAGQRRLTTVIDKVNSAIADEMRTLMGADEKTGATIYTPVLSALESGSGIAEAQKVLRRAGIDDDAIRSAVVSAYKEDYLYSSDEAGRKAIEAKLLKLKDADGEVYFTEADLAGWVMDWTLKGFNDSVYTDLDEALRGKNQLTAQQEIDRYMEAGKSAGSIRDRIKALFKDEYLKADAADRQKLAQFLLRLRGTKGEKLVTVDTLTGWIKDEAKKKAGK